jgi:hypothetical protein
MEAAMVKTSPPERPRRASEDLGNQAMVDNMSMLKIHDNGSAVFVGNVIVSLHTTSNILKVLKVRHQDFPSSHHEA